MEYAPVIVPFAGALVLSWCASTCIACGFHRRLRRVEARIEDLAEKNVSLSTALRSAQQPFIGGYTYTPLPPATISRFSPPPPSAPLALSALGPRLV